MGMNFYTLFQMIMSILIQFSEYIFIQFSHFKGEHPGDDLEDGEIMHKVKDGMNKKYKRLSRQKS